MATETISQVASPVDIHFVQGDSFSRTVQFSQSNSPLDVSSWTITAQIRRRASSSTAIDFTVDMTDAAEGLVSISISPEDAASLSLTNVWDLQRDLGGDIRTLLAGAVTVDREVTRG